MHAGMCCETEVYLGFKISMMFTLLFSKRTLYVRLHDVQV